MKRTTFIFSLLLLFILSGCDGNSKSASDKDQERLEIQKAEEAQENSEAARKSAEATEKEIDQLLN